MSSPQIEIQLIAAIVAMACAIPGVFLVLRKMALISDAISHSILPGIVIGFFVTQDLNSPLLILLAALTGVITVVMVEFIQKTGLVKEDTAIGLVFPVLFSIGVILIAKNANDVHLDVDAVLLGELAFAPFDRLLVGVADWGPKSLWVMGSILFITISLLILFYKELKVTTFDAGLSSILVVALMIAPAATAYLLTEDLKKMIWLSVSFGVFSAISGYWAANFLDASISGSIATTLGVIFLATYLFAPKKGLISVLYRQKQQRIEVSLITFLLHLNRHEEESERHINHLQEHINWQAVRARTVLDLAEKNNLVEIENNVVSLTEKGLAFTEKSLEYIISNKDEKIEPMKEDFFLFRG